MSTSTDGQISYGILFPEDYEFPWSASPFDGDINEWWLVESGWKWDGDEPFTEDGELATGFTSEDPRIGEYFRRQREWKKSNPLPIAEINYQSGDVPAYILAVPSSIKTANRGYPEPFVPESLIVNGQDRQALIDFCVAYGLEMDAPPSWYLSSYWG